MLSIGRTTAAAGGEASRRIQACRRCSCTTPATLGPGDTDAVHAIGVQKNTEG